MEFLHSPDYVYVLPHLHAYPQGEGLSNEKTQIQSVVEGAFAVDANDPVSGVKIPYTKERKPAEILMDRTQRTQKMLSNM